MWTVGEIKTDRSNEYAVTNNLGYAAQGITMKGHGTKVIPRPDLYGTHKRNIDAKRHIVELYNPELIGSSDEHIKRVAKEFFSGSHAVYKVVKLKSDEC